MSMPKILTFSGIISIILSAVLLRAEDKKTLWEELGTNFKKEYFTVGFVLQNVADFQMERSFPGNNGFSIANMRLIISGKLDQNFRYHFKANFINSPAILDANIQYSFSEKLILDAGQFKSPFSKEFLIPAESIDFVNRSRVVTLLAPGRQIGFQAKGKPLSNIPFQYAAGIFNGNGINTNTNDNNNFLYAARISSFPLKSYINSKGILELGINAAASRDSYTRIGAELNPFVFEPLLFSGERSLLGADIRMDLNRVSISAEYISGDFEGTFQALSSDTVLTSSKPHGYHLTAGYYLSPDFEILGRFDSFRTNNPDVSDWMILGWNLWPTQATEIQFNYIVNMDNSDWGHHQVLINAQLAF